MPVTIRDVAKRLNLSITTVSRALDGYDDVAEETRKQVERTAQEMGYVPSRIARQLRRKRSQAIGFIMPTEPPQYSDPFFDEFIAGMGKMANDQNYDLLTSSAPPASSEEQSIYQRWILARRVDGFVLNRLRLNDWRVHYLAANDVPFVTMQRIDDDTSYASIHVDGQGGIRKLVRLLHQRGHRRFAFIGGPPDLLIHLDRLQGYKDALVDHGIQYDPDMTLNTNMTYDEGLEAGKKILLTQDPPSALLCINDSTAIGVLDTARELGMKVGKDLVVTGFDGIRQGEHSVPSLTTLDQKIHRTASQLVQMLIQIILGSSVGALERRLDPELVLRASTGD
jgi:LacI family transcriptional regulator